MFKFRFSEAPSAGTDDVLILFEHDVMPYQVTFLHIVISKVPHEKIKFFLFFLYSLVLASKKFLIQVLV